MKKKLTDKTNALPTANCQLGIANCQLPIACFLPIALCLLLIANCLLPIVSFAQNTFRYEVCPDIGPLPRWQIAEYGNAALHQVPSDSGYISFAYARREILLPPNPPPDSLDWKCFSATKLDKYGKLSWIKSYQQISGLRHKIPNDGIPTADGGFVMAGYKGTDGPYFNNSGTSNTYIHKIDKDGHTVWANIYKVTNNNEDKAHKILQMPDGGYILLGEVKDLIYSTTNHACYNIYLLRLNSDGTKKWCYYYDAKKNGEEFPASLALADDGGFIIGGKSLVDAYYGFNTNVNRAGNGNLLMKVSGDGQTIEWAKAYSHEFNNYDYTVRDVKQTPDKGYIAVGITKEGKDNTRPKAWVLKTDALGAIQWQKSYDTWSGIDKVENFENGYLLGSTDIETSNVSEGNGYGRLSKISSTGETQWSKLYDGGIHDLNLTRDGGFILDIFSTKFSNRSKTWVYDKSIIKANRLGEYDDGCIYDDNLVSGEATNIDTVYTFAAPVSPTVTVTDLTLKEISISRNVCPVICDISPKPVAPSSIGGGGCANSDTPISMDPNWKTANYSHFKIDFGDPASGVNNYIKGSSMAEGYYGQVWHTYSNPGTYKVTMVVYNNDFSLTDTVFGSVIIVPKPIITLSTPSIHVCTKDTLIITATIENYEPGAYSMRWKEETFYSTYTNQTVLSETYTLQDSILTMVATVLTDTSQKYYVYGNSSHAANVCVMNDTVKVILGDNEAIITGNTKICKGGSTTLKASGGDVYLWSTGAITQSINVNPASNQTYWVEARTADGCRDTSYVYVQVLPEINVEVYAQKRVLTKEYNSNGDEIITMPYKYLSDKRVCLNDTVQIYATGAQNYTWSNGNTGDTIQVVSANGQNTFLVSGSTGACKDTASIVITANIKPNGSISGGPANSSVKYCNGYEYTLTASGGDSYLWSYSSFAVGTDRSNPIQTCRTVYDNSGIYTNTVYVFNGACADTAESIAPTPSYPPSVGGITVDECRVCPGETVTLRKYFRTIPSYQTTDPNIPYNQGLTYQWSTGQTTSDPQDSIKITVNGDTLISLTTTNSYGCSNTVSTLINANPHFFIKKEVSPIASCGNSPTTLYLIGEALSDFDYTWKHNGSHEDTLVVSPLQDTMYYATATAYGCTRTDSIWVEAKSNLPKAWINGDSIVCKGSPGTYFAKGDIAAQSYKWLTGNNADIQSSLTTPIAANTTLKVVVGFSGGCTDTTEYKISVVDVPQALILGDTLICPGGTTSLKAAGSNNYRWSTGEISPGINVTTSVDKIVKLYAFAGNCSDSAQVTVKTNQIITATLFTDEDTACTGTPLTLVAGGGDHYFWDNGEENQMLGILPPTTTTYTVTVTTKDNCKDTKSITIQVSPAPDAQINSARVCQGDSLILTASGGDNYLWNTGNVNASLILINPKADSVYRVKVSVGSCSDSTQAKVSVLPKPLVDAGADVSINYGNDVPLFATGTGTYLWSPASGLSCTDCASPLAEPAQNTLYYITLKDDNGCKSTDSVMVFVDLPCGDVFVPTAFSPNNDGINDIFYIRGRCIQSLNLTIYDRWGEKVFEAPAGTTKGWDGTYNDKPMNPAIFVFSLEATLTNGEVLSRKGSIVLMR